VARCFERESNVRDISLVGLLSVMGHYNVGLLIIIGAWLGVRIGLLNVGCMNISSPVH
jgi:hypothetical protein